MSVERPMGILQRAAALVDLLAVRGPLSPATIAEETGTPRPTVYRLGEALSQVHLAEQLSNSRLALDLRWLSLGDAARVAMSEWQAARPILDELAASTGGTVFLSVPRGEESVCIDWARGAGLNVLLLKPGRSLPLYAGAAGRVSLAYGVEDPGDYLSGCPFPAFTPHTLQSEAELRTDIEQTRSQGFVVSEQDVTEGIAAVGAPICVPGSDQFVGALSVAGLAEDLRSRTDETADRVRTSAALIAASLPTRPTRTSESPA